MVQGSRTFRQGELLAVLGDIYRDKGTGTLVLQNGQTNKFLYAQEGEFIFAASNAPEDKFTQILVERGRLTPEQLDVDLQPDDGLVGRHRQRQFNLLRIADCELRNVVLIARLRIGAPQSISNPECNRQSTLANTIRNHHSAIRDRQAFGPAALTSGAAASSKVLKFSANMWARRCAWWS